MEKQKLLFPRKVAILAFLLLAFNYQSILAQCTNPIPTGDVSQIFCKKENSAIANLSATGGDIVWYDAPAGGSLYGSTDVLVEGQTYYADDISGSGCSTSRLAVTVSIYGELPTNVNVFVGICALDNPTIADLSATGENIAWYDAQTDGNLLPLSQLLVNGKTYWVQQTENGCTSNRFPTTVSLINPITPTTNAVQSFCSSTNPKISNLQSSGTNVLWYDTETSLIPLKSTDLLIHGEDYWVAEISFPCVSLNRSKTTVVIDSAPNAGISSSLQECEIDLVTTNLFDLLGGTPDTTGIWTGPSVLTNGYLGTFVPGINTVGEYTYTVSSNLGICPAVSSTIMVTIIMVSPPTTTEAVQTFCEIENAKISDLSASGNNIVWYDTESSTTPLNSTNLLVDGKDYWGALTDPASSCLSINRLKITAKIIVTPPPTTTAINQSFCEIKNSKISDLNVTGNSVFWYATETSATPLNPTDLLVNGASYWGTQTNATSNCESATRLVVTVSIIATPPPTTSTQNQSFCEIEKATVADLKVTGSQVFWYATQTSTTPLNKTNSLVNGASYWASQTDATSDCESATRLMVNVSIIIAPPPTTTMTNQSFCEVDNPKIANLSASGTGIHWYATETSTAPLNPTDLLINGASYWASQTVASGCESVTRLVVKVSITTVPPPTTTITNQLFCEVKNPKISDLSASGTGLLWYANETSTTPLNPNDLLVNSASYWATQTGVAIGCESATRLVVTVTIIASVPPVIITQNKTFCEIENATVADLSPVGNILPWYASENATIPLNATTALINGEDYWTTQTNATSGCENSTKTVVKVSIISIPPPTTVKSNQSFCEIQKVTISDLKVTGSQVLWYATETSTTPLNTTNLLANGTYWASQAEPISGCESATRLMVNVSITTVPPPTTTAINQSFCVKDYFPNAPTVGDLNVSGNKVQWYANETSATPLNSKDLLTNGASYWASQTVSSGCESATRLMVNVALINPAIPTTSSVNQTFCLADKPTVANLLVNETNILWYSTATATTPLNTADLLVNGSNYWASNLNVATGCESIARLKVTVSINDVAPATIDAASQNFCESDSPTIANLQVAGNGIIWYATQTGTEALNPTNLLVNGTSYWAAQSNPTTGCESVVRVVVNVTLTTIAAPTLISLGNEFCKINNPKISDLNSNVSAVNGGIIFWYDAYPNGNPLSASTALEDGATYYAIETLSNGCKSTNPLAVTVSLEACEQYDLVIYDGFSPTGNGINDTFRIKNLRELYPDFKVEYYNRWGNLMYTANAANPDWNGRLNGDGELSPAGVYYFVIYFNKNDRKPIQRRLYLSR